MDDRYYVASFSSYGSAFVRVHYFLQIPMYALQFLETSTATGIVVMFPSDKGEWIEDGKGITALSQEVGRMLEVWSIAR